MVPLELYVRNHKTTNIQRNIIQYAGNHEGMHISNYSQVCGKRDFGANDVHPYLVLDCEAFIEKPLFVAAQETSLLGHIVSAIQLPISQPFALKSAMSTFGSPYR